MDLCHLSRLKEEQEKAILETKERIQKCENFKSDYRALQERLITLPDNVTHEVMVPFGKFAFMPGQIVHTNEVMVLLGDNWFVERSAKQAAEIAGRRIGELDKNVAELNKQMELLVPRLGFTSELQVESQVQSEVKEIRENYSEEAEREWDARHRENVRKHRKHERQKASKSSDKDDSGGAGDGHRESQNSSAKDDALWARLEELEKQEVERRELESDEEEEEYVNERTQSNHKKTRVSFADSPELENPERQRSQDSDDDDYDDYSSQEIDSVEEEDDSGGEDMVQTSKRKTIQFSHSKTPAILPHQMSAAGDMTISSPADVYKLFTPPSILKKVTKKASTHQANNSDPSHCGAVTRPQVDYSSEMPGRLSDHDTHADLPFVSSSQKAFSGQIVERVAQPSHTTDKQSEDQPRRVSKFKAKRMEQKGHTHGNTDRHDRH